MSAGAGCATLAVNATPEGTGSAAPAGGNQQRLGKLRTNEPLRGRAARGERRHAGERDEAAAAAAPAAVKEAAVSALAADQNCERLARGQAELTAGFGAEAGGGAADPAVDPAFRTKG